MPSQKGRDLLLKIGDGMEEESFSTLGAARLVSLALNNQPVDSTSMDSNGWQQWTADAGIQSLHIRLEGIFKDSAAEEMLRTAAFERTACNFRLVFPNGDQYAAAFVVESYTRGGNHDGLESFAAQLIRSGAGSFTKYSA